METKNTALRILAQKWLGTSPEMPVRVISFGRIPWNRRRYVCVRASRSAGALTFYFFLHDDGQWRMFPPDVERPMMSVSQCPA